MGNGFNKDKLKVASKMGSNRITLQTKKKENELIKSKHEIAVLVNSGKVSKAQIKVESIIRQENIIFVYELVSDYCDLIHERALFIASEKSCPEDLLEAICSIMYSAPRTDIKELTQLMQLFGAKYGKKFVETYKENKSDHVPKRITDALSTKPPPRSLVLEKLQEICDAHNVSFDASSLQVEEKAVAEPSDVEVDQEKVQTLVRYLMDPGTYDLTDQQKADLCRTHGGSPAESAAAVHIANEKIQEQQSAAAIPSQQREYTVTFQMRPFGMQWTETVDQKNLYVSSVDPGRLASSLGVTQGSLIVAVNGRIVENLGAAQVFQISKAQPLPLTITFRALTSVVANQAAPAPVMPHMGYATNPMPSPAPPSYQAVQAQKAQPAAPAAPGAPADLDPFGLPAAPGMEVPGAAPGATQGQGEMGLPNPPSNTSNQQPEPQSNGDPDYDDLEARFAALRNGL